MEVPVLTPSPDFAMTLDCVKIAFVPNDKRATNATLPKSSIPGEQPIVKSKIVCPPMVWPVWATSE